MAEKTRCKAPGDKLPPGTPCTSSSPSGRREDTSAERIYTAPTRQAEKTGGLKGACVHHAQREGKLPGLRAAPVLTDPTDPTNHPGLRGFVANSSRNSSVHLGFLLDARTEVLVGTGFPHHMVMKENTQPFQ